MRIGSRREHLARFFLLKHPVAYVLSYQGLIPFAIVSMVLGIALGVVVPPGNSDVTFRELAVALPHQEGLGRAVDAWSGAEKELDRIADSTAGRLRNLTDTQIDQLSPSERRMAQSFNQAVRSLASAEDKLVRAASDLGLDDCGVALLGPSGCDRVVFPSWPLVLPLLAAALASVVAAYLWLSRQIADAWLLPSDRSAYWYHLYYFAACLMASSPLLAVLIGGLARYTAQDSVLPKSFTVVPTTALFILYVAAIALVALATELRVATQDEGPVSITSSGLTIFGGLLALPFFALIGKHSDPSPLLWMIGGPAVGVYFACSYALVLTSLELSGPALRVMTMLGFAAFFATEAMVFSLSFIVGSTAKWTSAGACLAGLALLVAAVIDGRPSLAGADPR